MTLCITSIKRPKPKKVTHIFWFTKKYILPFPLEITRHFHFSSEKMCHVPGCAVTLCVMAHRRLPGRFAGRFPAGAIFRITAWYLIRYLNHHKIHRKRVGGTDLGKYKMMKPLVSGAGFLACRVKTIGGRCASLIPFQKCSKKKSSSIQEPDNAHRHNSVLSSPAGFLLKP